MFHIVLDTEVFRSAMLNFRSSPFVRLAEFVGKNQASIYLSDIVVAETRRAIAERTKEAADYLRKGDVRRLIGYLQHCPSANVPGIATKIDAEDARKDLDAAFENLLSNLRATTISTDGISVAELRRRYFGPVAPFGQRAEKKHEFPDALTFLAIEQYAIVHEIEMFIISADKGFASAVTDHARLRCAADIREMIDLILKHSESMAAAAGRIGEILGGEFKRRIAEQFVDGGLTIVDEVGDVDDITVTSVSHLRTYVADIEANIATIDFNADVTFIAEVSYDDPEQLFRDSETGEIYVFGSIEKEIKRVEFVEGQAVIAIDPGNLAASEIRDFQLSGDFTIEVSPPENYK